jgi:protein associated with RNAse G/E
MRDIRVVYRKFDGSLHWHLTMKYLGEDEHGIWVGMAAGGFMRKGDGPLVPIPQANIGLFPHAGWWTAWFNADPERVDIYCDITTPPQWISDDEVTMIDLDLDVARKREDGSVHLLDEDEFAEHQTRYAYPPDVIENAAAAARWLQETIGSGAEPFASVHQQWMARVA